MGSAVDNKVGPEYQHYDGSLGCCGCLLAFFSVILIVCTLPFSICLMIKTASEYERAVIFRLGRISSDAVRGPGIFCIIPCLDEIRKFDIRSKAHDVPPQEILTKDSVAVTVDAILYYRVRDSVSAACNVEDADRATHLLVAATLRNVLGTKMMVELLAEREGIALAMKELLDVGTLNWGIEVERVEIKDVRLPYHLQRAMAAEAEAAREAKAKVVAAEGEQHASLALKEAADVMAESPAAMQLRFLQTINMVSSEKSSIYVFPMPIDVLLAYMDRSTCDVDILISE